MLSDHQGTLLVPTNDAFSEAVAVMGQSTIDAIKANTVVLRGARARARVCVCVCECECVCVCVCVRERERERESERERRLYECLR